VKVIVEMAPPDTSEKSASCAAAQDCQVRERCHLFHRKAYGVPVAVGSLIYTPAMINMNQGLPAAAPSTFGLSFDTSGLRHLQEMQFHLATYGAQRAAEKAFQSHMDQELSRVQGALQGLGAGTGSSGVPAGSEVTLQQALTKLDKRLSDLEGLAQAHHGAIDALVKVSLRQMDGKIDSKQDSGFTMKDSAGKARAFVLADPTKVPIVDASGKFATAKLEALNNGDEVTVTYQQVGDTLVASLIRKTK
jgi:hypothetical protein